MVRFQRGDSDALGVLVRRHEVRLYNFALRHLRSPPAAEDVVQEVFLRVVEGAGTFQHASRFTTWAYTIARNRCIDHTRRASLRRHPSLDAPGDGADGDGAPLGERLADPGASVERQALGGELSVRIVAAVEALPDDQREVFLLRQIAALPFAAIAEIVDVPENTVKSRMRYALDRLKLALGDFEEYARALR